MTNKYLFGSGKGHLPEEAHKLAAEHGAVLINFTDPGTHEKRHWFSCRNRGEPFNQNTKRAVLTALRGLSDA